MSDRKNRRNSLSDAFSRSLRGPLKYMLLVILLLLAAAAVLFFIRNARTGLPVPAAGGEAPAGDPAGAEAESGLRGALSSAAGETAEQVTAMTTFEEKDITIGCTGAMIMHSPILEAAAQPDGSYDFSSVFRFITPYYSRPDFMTCELEAAVASDPDTYSGHPMFRIPGSLVTAIADSGVDLQLLATNHIYDGHREGLLYTMDFFEENGLAWTGIRKSPEDPRWYIADIKGIKVGFFNYTLETEGNGTWINAIQVPEDDAALINSFWPEQRESFYQEARLIIEELHRAGAQFIIANLHWGMEYMLEPFEYQKEMAQTLCNMGVNALIGGHPHCEEPISVIESTDGSSKMFCIYSVGNAMSNQMEEFMIMDMAGGYTEDGVIITLQLHQSADGSVALAGVDATPTWMYRSREEDGTWTYDFCILPLDDADNLEKNTGLKDIKEQAAASYARTMSVIGDGLAEAQQTFGSPSEN